MVDQPQTEVEQIHQTDGESGETDSKIQKEVVACRIGRDRRSGAKLGLLPTHKYWTALAHTKLKPNKHESKTLQAAREELGSILGD